MKTGRLARLTGVVAGLAGIVALSGTALSTPSGVAASSRDSSARLCDRYAGAPQAFGVAGGADHLAAAGSMEPASQGAVAATREAAAPAGMVLVQGGSFRMGAENGYAEEQPVRWVRVASFWIDRHEVTNAQFERFVQATGYRTSAERGPNPGSVVFVPPQDPSRSGVRVGWWRWRPAADWRHPDGPGSSIADRMNHPVVQVTYEDALAYATWAGRSLPTEAQWEYAARGGLDGKTYVWGDVDDPQRANTWQGPFPYHDAGTDGHVGTAPVGCHSPNGYGLFDMVGNVWEWTGDPYRSTDGADPMGDPMVPSREGEDRLATPLRVIKGGSFLCSPDYCARHRPASRQPQDATLGTVHIGFRTVMNADRAHRKARYRPDQTGLVRSAGRDRS